MCVYGPSGIGRNLVAVGAAQFSRGHLLHLSAAIQFTSVQIALGSIVWRGNKIQPAIFFIDGSQFHDIEFAGGQIGNSFAITRHFIDVSPAAALTLPNELLGIFQPIRVDQVFNVRFFPLGHEIGNFTTACIGVEESIGILFSIELLDQHLLAVIRPIHPWDVHVLGHTRQGDPNGFTLVYRHDTYFCC